MEQDRTSATEFPNGAFNSEPAWFCVRTHPKHEHIAAAHLSLIPNVEVFHPQLRFERITRRGLLRTRESLFTNYLFARFVLETTLEKIRYAPSVNRVLQFGDKVATIPDDVIEDLRRSVAESADVVFSDAPMEGDEVEILVGPFGGERGIVTRILPARQRVKLLLEVMGRSIPADFSLSSIIFKSRTPAHQLLSTA